MIARMDDINPERRAEYLAAVAAVTPQIVGLASIVNDPDISQETRGGLQQELESRSRRKRLLEAALLQLDHCNDAQAALVEDGYPALPKSTVTEAVFEELRARREAIEAAIDQFETIVEPPHLTITLGNPADKPEA